MRRRFSVIVLQAVLTMVQRGRDDDTSRDRSRYILQYIVYTRADRFTAYASATTTSVGLAVGLNQLVPRLRSITPATRSLLTKFVPFVAVASAGFVNIALMRWKEIKDGVDVFPPSVDGVPSEESLGKSSTAGMKAVGQTAAYRILTNMCVLSLLWRFVPSEVIIRTDLR